MITKCRFCDYQKATPLDLGILAKVSDINIPLEDYHLYMRELVSDIRDYNSVKIHMGRMHKAQTYKYIMPESIFEPKEKEVMDSAELLT